MAITKPYTFIAGTKARAGEVNQDFDVVYSEVNRLGTEILGIDVDIQNISDSKADINGNATQRFQVANPENSYDSVNKNYLENSILNIKDYINGLTIVKDTDNTIRVSSGSCYDSTYTTMMVSTGNITKENTTQLSNGTYYVYIISDDSGYQVDVLITTSSVTPPLPSGYTVYRQIGSYTTDDVNKIDDIYYYGNNSISNKNITGFISAIMPDYSRATTWNTSGGIVPYDCLLAFYVTNPTNLLTGKAGMTVYIDDVCVYATRANEYEATTGSFLGYAPKGANVVVTVPGQSANYAYIIPLKGVN